MSNSERGRKKELEDKQESERNKTKLTFVDVLKIKTLSLNRRKSKLYRMTSIMMPEKVDPYPVTADIITNELSEQVADIDVLTNYKFI